MVKLAGTFSHFKPFHVLVLGDFMLDIYTYGKVNRVSPEAPVMILHTNKKESLPGGAGNVALNLESLGAHVRVLGRIGADEVGTTLKERLKSQGIQVEGLLIEKNFKTPLKNRLIADHQQIIRVDEESVSPLSQELEEFILSHLDLFLQNISVIAISDYNKGFMTKSFLAQVILKAREKNILVLCDPKGHDFRKYKDVYLIKPNLKEAYHAASLPQTEPIEKVAQILLNKTQAQFLFITRSKEGISLFSAQGTRKDFPVKSREVIDVTGAGDKVLAMICAALANKMDIEHAAHLANIAASIAIEKLGCARITLPMLALRLLETDSDNKIFDESHLYALQSVLENKPFSLLALDGQDGFTTKLFQTITHLSAEELILYIKDPNPDKEFVRLLSSLNEVKFIILKKESLKNLLKRIHPHEVYVMNEDEPIKLQSKEELTSILA